MSAVGKSARDAAIAAWFAGRVPSTWFAGSLDITVDSDEIQVVGALPPPELAADIMEQGIVLTGGGALLHGLESRLTQETGMPIVVARDPLNCVAIGSGQCLEEFEALKQVLITSSGR